MMRKQFPLTIFDMMSQNSKIFVLLGDIGVFSFYNVRNTYPDRIINVGIMEQTMVGVASGLAINGYLPVVHTIASFLVERAYEQLKVDFGYQKLSGIFVSVGGSYDYSKLGATHHSPADVNLIYNIPGFIILIPGNSSELEILLKSIQSTTSPVYVRLSERENSQKFPINLKGLFVIRKGTLATIIVVGNMLDKVLPDFMEYDVNILYCTTVSPFDFSTLNMHHRNQKIIIIEPYYSGTILNQISSYIAFSKVLSIAVPRDFIHSYGTIEYIDVLIGLDRSTIAYKIKEFINGG
jgi:transketolase